MNVSAAAKHVDSMQTARRQQFCSFPATHPMAYLWILTEDHSPYRRRRKRRYPERG